MPLVFPNRVWSRAEVLSSPSPVPRAPGIYAWYFRNLPKLVPTDGCIRLGDLALLYIGIAPKAPPQNGRRPSSQKLWHRIRYHYRGNAEGSTLRLTLGCLLAGELGLELRRVGSGRRMTFGHGEAWLSEWMSENAFVTWAEDTAPWITEAGAIADMPLPLNLDMNRLHPFHATLTDVRRLARERARSLPVLN